MANTATTSVAIREHVLGLSHLATQLVALVDPITDAIDTVEHATESARGNAEAADRAYAELPVDDGPAVVDAIVSELQDGYRDVFHDSVWEEIRTVIGRHLTDESDRLGQSLDRTLDDIHAAEGDLHRLRERLSAGEGLIEQLVGVVELLEKAVERIADGEDDGSTEETEDSEAPEPLQLTFTSGQRVRVNGGSRLHGQEGTIADGPTVTAGIRQYKVDLDIDRGFDIQRTIADYDLVPVFTTGDRVLVIDPESPFHQRYGEIDDVQPFFADDRPYWVTFKEEDGSLSRSAFRTGELWPAPDGA